MSLWDSIASICSIFYFEIVWFCGYYILKFEINEPLKCFVNSIISFFYVCFGSYVFSFIIYDDPPPNVTALSSLFGLHALDDCQPVNCLAFGEWSELINDSEVKLDSDYESPLWLTTFWNLIRCLSTKLLTKSSSYYLISTFFLFFDFLKIQDSLFN